AGGRGRRSEEACRGEQRAAAGVLQAKLEEAGAAGQQGHRQVFSVPVGVERIDDGIERRKREAGHPSEPPMLRRMATPSSVIFLRSVLRLIPSMSAAFT